MIGTLFERRKKKKKIVETQKFIVNAIHLNRRKERKETMRNC